MGGRRILAPVGTLRSGATEGLLDTYFAVIEDGAQEVWLDLSEVTAVEGAALDAVCRMAAFGHELERRTLVVCPVGKVRKVLSATGIDQDLEVYESLRDAQHSTARTASASR
jgi:anti-anti-sigma regulatory factor